MPRVSVVMSVFNGEPYLREAVDSIANQTFADFEFIIVDDGSTDGTADILKSYDDPRIQVIDQENRGLTASLNQAAGLANGRLIARMDADDISEPTRLEKQVMFMKANRDVGLVGTWYFEIDGQNRKRAEKEFPVADYDLRKTMIRYNPFCHGSVMFRKALFDKVGGYDESFKKAQDYDLWFKMVSRAKLANIPEYLFQRRYTNDNISIADENAQISYALAARKNAIKRGQYSSLSYFFLIRPLVVSFLPGGLKRRARKYFFAKTIK